MEGISVSELGTGNLQDGAMQHLKTISRMPKPAQLDIATQLEIKVNQKVATIERKAAQIR